MGETDAPEVAFDKVTKRYAGGGDGPAALTALDLSAARGEFLVIIGPSGCGKSTTLRLLAGLESPDGGKVSIAGRVVNDVPPQERDVAMVFQGYALYPHMTVRQNLEFPLKMRKVGERDRARVVSETAETLKLGALLDRRPDELSGGERQRVAMGRALVRKPRVFLFDEPLSNLDAALRSELRTEIGATVARLEATALYVTHDHVEAMTLADRIAVLRAGRLLQVATPRELYERPADSFVAGFVGTPRINLIDAVVDGAVVRAGPLVVARPAGDLPARLQIGARPEHVRLGVEGGARATVRAVEPLGAETHLVLDAGGVALRARASGFARAIRGEVIRIALDEGSLLFFDPADGGRRVAVGTG